MALALGLGSKGSEEFVLRSWKSSESIAIGVWNRVTHVGSKATDAADPWEVGIVPSEPTNLARAKRWMCLFTLMFVFSIWEKREVGQRMKCLVSIRKERWL